jgi:hypothetical protein
MLALFFFVVPFFPVVLSFALWHCFFSPGAIFFSLWRYLFAPFR